MPTRLFYAEPQKSLTACDPGAEDVVAARDAVNLGLDSGINLIDSQYNDFQVTPYRDHMGAVNGVFGNRL
jgi:hypothetical protein